MGVAFCATHCEAHPDLYSTVYSIFDWSRLLIFSASTQSGRKVATHHHLDELAAKASAQLAHPGLLHRKVEYFAPNRESPLPPRDPLSIPFLKHERFQEQAEYRVVFALSGGLKLRSRIAIPSFRLDSEIASARTYERLLRLGTLKGCAKIVRRA